MGRRSLGNARVQATWVAGTTLIVLFLATFGTFSLLDSAKGASGGGQGSDPLVTPRGKALQVQVIGQQWAWTFRYPGQRRLRDDAPDAAGRPARRVPRYLARRHALVLGLRARRQGRCRAGQPTTSRYVTPQKLETFSIRCAEVCGLWHGYMSTHGEVVTDTAFVAWLRSEKTAMDLADARAAAVRPPSTTPTRHGVPDERRRRRMTDQAAAPTGSAAQRRRWPTATAGRG